MPSVLWFRILWPDRRLLWLLLAWTLLGGVAAVCPGTVAAWLVLGGLLALVALTDALLLLPWPQLTAERFTAPILPLGVWNTIRLRLHNTGSRSARLVVFDHYPQPAEFSGLPQRIRVGPGHWSELSYRIRPLERGELCFGAFQVLMSSPLMLWQRSVLLAAPQPVKVFPNFATVAKYALLAHDRRIAAMGIHRRRRRGEGQDFYQLREYRDGDSLRQIDWKATARHRKLITKEYQDERDQQVVFLLDCSRRMRARDGDLSHFDHALNAMILLSYVALRQGDAVGVQSFGGISRLLAAQKGPGVLHNIINTVYDLQPTLGSADYATAANRLIVRQRKRALVVVLTNLRDEDSDELRSALQLLGCRHLVLIANLRESVLDHIVAQAVDDFRQARLYAATCHYLAARGRCQEQLRRQGAVVLDARPEDLPVAMVNHYLDIKRSGRL